MVWIILLSFTAILCSPLFISGQQIDGSYLVNGGHDVFWHLSLVKELTRSISPQFPGLSGSILQNYHYLTHIIFSIIPRITNFPIPFLYFKFYNPLLIFLLSLTIYKTAGVILSSRFQSLLVTFVTLFSGSLAFLIHDLIWKGSMFKIDQPYDQLFNLHTTLGYLLVFTVIYLLLIYQRSKDPKHLYRSTYIIATLFAVKIFFALPLLIGFATFIYLEKNLNKSDRFLLIAHCFLLPISILSLVISTYANSISFQPLWLLQKMTESINLPYIQDLLIRQQLYQTTSNHLRLIQILIIQLLIYLLGNYWVRFAGWITILDKRNFDHPLRSFFIVSILTSTVLPILVVTKPDNFNTVQFGQVSILLLSFTTGIYLSRLNITNFLKISVSIAISTTFFHDFFFTHKYSDFIIDKHQVQALSYLSGHSQDNDIVLVNNGNQYDMIVPAISGRRTYFNGIKVSQLLGYDYSIREKQNNDFFSLKMTKLDAEKFIIENDIKSIFMIKNQDLVSKYGLGPHLDFQNDQFQVISTDIRLRSQ